MFSINCKGKLISLQKPIVMGILNVTPDSFYEVNDEKNIENIVTLAHKMMAAGATILDVGGQSTRPNSERISEEVELNRVLPVIEILNKQLPNAIISVDTYYSAVATASVAAGASMVNDISGGQFDANMITYVGKMQVPYICMHTVGEPANMQQHTNYNDILFTIMQYFVRKKQECLAAGIHDLIIDPGFGFAKTAEQNFYLLKQLETFNILDCALLVGLSRKSTIYKTLNTTAADALNGSTVLHTIALQNGANILRVHDVKEAMEAITLLEHYKNSQAN